MSEVANIYDNGPISPVARIKDNISVYSSKLWFHYQILFIEPIPRSSPLTIEMVALAGATTIAANGTIAKRLIPILQMVDGDMMHLRFEPLDDVEGAVWEQSGTGRFNVRNGQARVDMTTGYRDPYLASTTVFVMGYQRDMNLEVFNPNPIALNQARFIFWGYRYVLEEIEPDLGRISSSKEKERITQNLALGDKELVAQYIGPTTWLPAEGR